MRSVVALMRRIGTGRIIGLLLLADFLLLRAWDPVALEALRHKAFDFYQVLQPRPSPPQQAAIVDIDEASLKALGQWPWPRTIVADLVARLYDAGAAVIGFDVLFPEADRTSPLVAAEAFRGLDDVTREALRRLPDNDAVLAAAIARARVVLGQSGFRITQIDDAARAPLQTGLAILGADPRPMLVSFPHLLRNLPPLEAAAAGRGLFSIRPEADGIIRRIPLLATADGVIIPALTLDMIRVAREAGAILVRSDATGVQSVGVPGLEVPTDSRGRAWLHFSPHDPTRFIPAIDILRGDVPRERLGGKLVLIGTSAVGLLDLKTSPIEESIPGVELHAQVLESILTGTLLRRPAWATGIEVATACLLSVFLIVLGPIVRAGTLLVLGGITAALTVGLSWLAFAEFRVLIDTTFPVAASFSVYLILVFTNYIRAASERQKIRSAFTQYISPALVDELARSPEKLALGGDRRDMTVMFSDVRGFTAVSETYKEDPQGLTSLLNRLLTPLTNAIIDQKGTIDKYMGDGIMAFWNAPLPDQSHEANACAASLQMLEKLAALNEERAREAEASGQPVIPLRIGIGLNTGPCFVGNFGSDLRFNYSVLGDTVNVASRLESQCKTYGVAIIGGERTAKAVADSFAVLELDRIQVVGKSHPERVFTVLGGPDVATLPAFRELSVLNQLMLSAYRGGEWQEALGALLRSRDLARSFGLEVYHALMVERIRRLIESPPVGDWHGISVLETK